MKVVNDNSNVYKDTIVNILKSFKSNKGNTLSLDEIIDEITLFIIAGHETTANTSAWAV